MRLGTGALYGSAPSRWTSSAGTCRSSAASRRTATSARLWCGTSSSTGPRMNEALEPPSWVRCGTSSSTGARMNGASEPLVWDPAEQLPREKLRALQLERLRSTFEVELESLDGVAS